MTQWNYHFRGDSIIIPYLDWYHIIMHAPSGDWSTETVSSNLWSKRSTSKPPQLDTQKNFKKERAKWKSWKNVACLCKNKCSARRLIKSTQIVFQLYSTNCISALILVTQFVHWSSPSHRFVVLVNISLEQVIIFVNLLAKIGLP